jgi:methanethiol oxidase
LNRLLGKAHPRAGYARIVGAVAATHAGDEFHHFGWNACSSCLSPNAPHPHVDWRYLIVPGLRSSRIYILDTKPAPRAPRIIKVIEPQKIADGVHAPAHRGLWTGRHLGRRAR